MIPSRLIESNVEGLEESIILLQRIEASCYSEPAARRRIQRSGFGITQTLRLYENLLNGLPGNEVEYDAMEDFSKHDLPNHDLPNHDENRPWSAMRIRKIIGGLQAAAEYADALLWVRIKTDRVGEDQPAMLSSVARELAVLRSQMMERLASAEAALQE